ncbi:MULTISPECIES: hypothetical protein [Pseudomonas]|uniref:Uncharacterized protein n=1 Tax=Pseudomonas nitroreducens TaxID=46680 RepID=A0A6G6J8E7_PSENT|nr:MULTISPECIES: hypothetical protein [Pseudomonas]MDU4255326.1 hypothetical protein [Pseudomonas sp.]QIE91483.1 hypothetical protein G5B91_34700 [Pseudomonas nitroreducens]
MKLKLIVEKEALRAEALLADYLGLSAGSIDLADFEVDYMKRATPELKRCVRLIQDLAVSEVSKTVAHNLGEAVDTLAMLVRAPQMARPIRILWDLEEGIRRTPVNVVRHLMAVAGAVALGVWGTVEKGGAVDLGLGVGALLLMLSFACSLSHVRDPGHGVVIGLFATCTIGAVVLFAKGVLIAFLVFAVAAAGFFLRDFAQWVGSAKPALGTHHHHEPVGAGDFTFEEMYDMSGAPGPSLTGYDKGDNE